MGSLTRKKGGWALVPRCWAETTTGTYATQGYTSRKTGTPGLSSLGRWQVAGTATDVLGRLQENLQPAEATHSSTFTWIHSTSKVATRQESIKGIEFVIVRRPILKAVVLQAWMTRVGCASQSGSSNMGSCALLPIPVPTTPSCFTSDVMQTINQLADDVSININNRRGERKGKRTAALVMIKPPRTARLCQSCAPSAAGFPSSSGCSRRARSILPGRQTTAGKGH